MTDDMRCRECHFRIKPVRALDGTTYYVHRWPEPAAPDGTVVDTPEWRTFTTEYGYELGMYVFRTQGHDASP